MRTIRSFCGHLLAWCVFCAIGLFPLVLSPFGVDLTSPNLNYKLLQVLMSPFYDVNSSDSVLAVIVTDDTVDAMDGQSWPIDYEQHGELLATIMQFHPCAIILDVNFSQRRLQDETLAALVESLEVAREDFPLPGVNGFCRFPKQSADGVTKGDYRTRPTDIPIIAAAGINGTSPTQKSEHRDNSRFLQSIAIPAVSGWESSDVNYPLFLFDDDDEMKPPQMTVAMRAFYEIELKHRRPELSPTDILKSYREDIFLHWGYDTPKYKDSTAFAFDQSGCEKTAGTSFGNFIDLAISPGKWLNWRDENKHPAQPCPPILQMDAGHLLAASWAGSDFLKTMIEGKIIVYGANIASHPDLYESPVHGALPALFYHAVALDNLLTKNDEYLGFRVRDETVNGFSLSLSVDIAIVLVMVTAYYWISSKLREAEDLAEKAIDQSHIARYEGVRTLWLSRALIARTSTRIQRLNNCVTVVEWTPVVAIFVAVAHPLVTGKVLPFHVAGVAVSTFVANLIMRSYFRQVVAWMFIWIGKVSQKLGRIILRWWP